MGCATALCCVVVKRLLYSLAMFFKQVNPVSPIDLREFDDKMPYLWIGMFSLENIEIFLPPSKRWPYLLELAKVAVVG